MVIGGSGVSELRIDSAQADVIKNLGFGASLIMLILASLLSIIVIICGFFLIYTVYFRFLRLLVIVPMGAIAFSTMGGNRTVSSTMVVDYEGATTSPDNYYDILAVYMVKHGMGDTAISINDTTKGWIQSVVDDMCSYTTSSGSEEVLSEDGVTSVKHVLYVNVNLKTYHDMISIYGFTEEQKNILGDLMASELFLPSMPGDHKSKLSREEIEAILSGITDERVRTACSFALSKVGYPYSQAYRDSGNYFDCI